MKQGDVLSGTYQVISEIGRGGTGIVYLAYHLRLKKYVALKQINSRNVSLQQLRRETDILKNLKHPNLPQIYDFIITDNKAYTVMDYIKGTALDKLSFQPGKLDEELLLSWIRQLSGALEYLHSQKPAIIHSDIKPGNIMLMENGSLCLIDFNIALGENSRGKVIGYSAIYASPEQIFMAEAVKQRKPSRIILDARSDQYSLAATFYYLISGYIPQPGVQAYPLSKIEHLSYSQGFLSVIDRAMSWERRKRYKSTGDFIKALDNLEKQEAKYRKYITAKALCFCLSGILAIAGAGCIYCGINSLNRQMFLEQYERFYEAVHDEDGNQILEKGIGLLNNNRFDRIIKSDKDRKAEILLAIGDCYYKEENYEASLAYYVQAIDCAEDKSLIGKCYQSYIVALTYCGKTVQAQTVLDNVKLLGISDMYLITAEVGLCSVLGEAERCAELTNQLILSGADINLCAEACLLTAQSGFTGEAEIEWLEKAMSYTSSKSVIRRIGNIYATEAEKAKGQASKNYAKKALECYEAIYNDHPLQSDKINYALMLRFLDEVEESIRILKECESADAGDSHVLMYLAMLYFESNQTSEAKYYCNRAIKQLETLTEAKRKEMGQDEIEYLYDISYRLGK